MDAQQPRPCGVALVIDDRTQQTTWQRSPGHENITPQQRET